MTEGSSGLPGGVPFDPFRPTKCRSCKADIRFVRGLEPGRFMPLDLVPVPDGAWAIVDQADGPHLVNAKEVDAPLFGIAERFRSHWATCPDATDWHKRTMAENRKRGPGVAPPGVAS